MENKEDYEKLQKEMSELFDENHTCEFIEHVIDVAEKALIDWNSKKTFNYISLQDLMMYKYY